MDEHHRRVTGDRPELSVVIPTHNRSGILRATLQNLALSTLPPPWEIVVVANACGDDTAEVVAEMAEIGLPVRLVEERRASASIARNRGAGEATGPLLVFLDDDILLRPESLAKIAAWYAGSDQRSILVGEVLPLPEHLATPFGAFRQRAHGAPTPGRDPVEVDWFASGLAAVPAASFDGLGGYAETYPAAGLEDADFAIRARRSGHRIVFHPSVAGLHNDWAGTTARDYCRRAAVHCSTAPLLAERFPDNDHPWGRQVEVNRPPASTDRRSTRLRKRLKQAAVVVAADRWLPALADRAMLPRRPRELLYRVSVSLAMYAGYQRGLRRLAEVRPGAEPGQVHRPPRADGSLSIIIVSFNCVDEVERAIESLVRDPPSISHEIMVVDNASADGTVARLAVRFPNLNVMALEENIGYGSAVNLAVKEAEGRYLLLLNPDTETTPGAIDILIRHADSTDRVGVVGPRLVLGTGMAQPSARRLPSPWRLWFEVLRLHLLLPARARRRLLAGTYSLQDEPGRVDWVSGACHLIPRGVWEEIGGLTERTFCGFDDLDYCWRARDGGFDTWFCPDAVITHHCGVSVARRWTSAEVDSVGIHNMYVVLEDHWSRRRVKLYCAAELIGTISDLVLAPRRAGLDSDEATAYRAAALARGRLLANLLLGRIRPIERHEPAGRVAQPPRVNR
ncbi:MAG: glycosyltransferase [Acidimicrobiales bacterium]